MAEHLQYELEDGYPKGPNAGYLFTRWNMRDEGLIGNSHIKALPTGVTVTIPSGTTVRVRGLFENEARGVRVTPMDINGPVVNYKLTVVMHNQANATYQLEKDRPIAIIEAFATPKPKIWHEKQPKQDLVGQGEAAA